MALTFLKKIPLPFLFYMVPMLGTTLGLLPAAHPLYNFLSQQLLPVCLVLLLIGTDMKSIARLGPQALLLMGIGSLGTIAGGILSFKLYRPWLPEGSWASIGALTASWIGGSANLIAVKEALNAPDALVAPIIIVDAVMAYSWMALLLWASAWQNRWDKFVSRETLAPGSSDAPLEVTSQGRGSQTRVRAPARPGAPPRARSCTKNKETEDHAPLALRRVLLTPHPLGDLLVATLISVAISLCAQWAGGKMPSLGGVLSPITWTVLLVTTASLALSLTPVRSLEKAGASRLGTFFLYMILASIGARSNFQAIAQAPVFLALGATWILIHGVVLLAGGYFLRSPLGMMAAASQANIGGTVSAPIVGATYHPQLASVGLLMAILGNLMGTYLGLATAFFLKS